MEDWSAFLGWYLSEGSGSQGYITQISQTKYPEIVESVLKKLPFKFSYDKKMFRISSVQLATYLKKYGLCNKKYVPDYIKNASKEIIRIFLDNFNLGDGSIRKDYKIYFTTSKRLADDLQELIFKVGSVSNISTRHVKGTMMSIKGKDYLRKHDSYILIERTSFKDFWFETGCRKSRYISEVPYKGNIYCVTVPNGTLYVRRKGKPFWSGNCARAGSPPSELYQEFYVNLPEIIWKGANGILVDPEPISKYGAELLVHSSWADTHWQPVDFPEKYRQNIKLRNCCIINGRYYVIPQAVGLPEIGAIVGWGESLDKAKDMCLEIAETVEGYYIEIPKSAFDTADEEIEKSEEYGLGFFE